MSGEDALATIAEIAIAIAGFSGIAAVLGRRSHGHWAPEDAYRFQALLFSSFTPVLFSFLPIVVLLAGVAPTVAWPMCSGAWLTALVSIGVIRGRTAYKMSQTTGNPLARGALIVLGLPVLAMVILHGANVFVFRESWPYVAAAVCSLTVPFTFFVQLLRYILKPDEDAG